MQFPAFSALQLTQKDFEKKNACNPIFYLACILLTFLKKTVPIAICVLPSSYAAILLSVVELNLRYSIFNSFPNTVN